MSIDSIVNAVADAMVMRRQDCVGFAQYVVALLAGISIWETLEHLFGHADLVGYLVGLVSGALLVHGWYRQR